MPSVQVRNLKDHAVDLFAADGTSVSVPAKATVPIHTKFVSWVKPPAHTIRLLTKLPSATPVDTSVTETGSVADPVTSSS